MGDHESKTEGDGQGQQPYDHTKTKSIDEASGGTHSADDKDKK